MGLPELDSRTATLDAAEAWIWQKLARATKDRHAAWRTPVLATTGSAGAPQARIVVLRAVSRPQRQLTLHTDARAGKLADVAAQPRIALNFYDPGDHLQLRLEGSAALADGVAVDEAWSAVPEPARRNYRTLLPPGAEVAAPDAELAGDGRRNFAILDVSIDGLEFLWLGPSGHRRGRFLFDAGAWARSWRVP